MCSVKVEITAVMAALHMPSSKHQESVDVNVDEHVNR